MRYDIHLTLEYVYETPVSGGRHLVRVAPRDLPGIQRVVATTLTPDPTPAERDAFPDFFGNQVTALAYRFPHDHLTLTLSARVEVQRDEPTIDLSPDRETLRGEIASNWDMSAASPHHYLGESSRIPLIPEIAAYARDCTEETRTVIEAARALCTRIHADFAYDGEATLVDTPVAEAFALRRGVCQDFSHIMIAGLRGLGIPAGYVSGYLRTLPPPGQQRLEGADAMHAWVRAWCGYESGWVEFDPTNATLVGRDHIVIGYGRDYADATPIIGVLRSAGGHETHQAVDVRELA